MSLFCVALGSAGGPIHCSNSRRSNALAIKERGFGQHLGDRTFGLPSGAMPGMGVMFNGCEGAVRAGPVHEFPAPIEEAAPSEPKTPDGDRPVP